MKAISVGAVISCIAMLTSCGQQSAPEGGAASVLELAVDGSGNPTCGDGLVGPGECDDGNTASGDGCSSTCTEEANYKCPPAGRCFRCGNGVVNLGYESCDDANNTSNDGCSATCTLETGWSCPTQGQPCVPLCGNGSINAGETCDDGNAVAGDGCSTCTVDADWVCSGSPSQCHLVVCGDGTREGAEGCDDGQANSDILKNRCRTNCQPARCGDGIEDNARPAGPGVLINEICDDGPFNGQPGSCNATCDGFNDMVSEEVAVTFLAAPAGMVGLFLSDSYLLAMCIEVDAPGFLLRDDFIANNEQFVGRVVELIEDIVIDNPIAIRDDGMTPFSGPPLYAGSMTDTQALYGSYFVPAGSMVMTSIYGGLLGNCDGCGTRGTFSSISCMPPGGPTPNPMPCLTSTCNPEFDHGSPHDFSIAPEFPVDPSTPPSLIGHCAQECMFAGGRTGCDGSPSLPQLPPDRINCSPPDLHVNRACSQMGAVVEACACESPGSSCVGLNPGAPFDVFDKCQFALNLPPSTECGDRFDEDTDSATDGAITLAFLNQLCHSEPANPRCEGFKPPQDRAGINIVACEGGAPGTQGMCAVCSPFTGHGCLPTIDIPAWMDVSGGGLVALTGAQSASCQNDGGCSEPSREVAASSGARLRMVNPKLRQQLANDPVSLLSGELIHDTVDVSFPARGVPFEFRRHYRSGGLRSGALGPGFSHSYEERIVPIGDLTNRVGVPAWCTADLPLTNCLLRTDEGGGTELWVRDPSSIATFMPPPGIQGSIVVRLADRELHMAADIADLNATTDYVYEMLSPGGILRTYDLSGVLLSVTDDQGFGVFLKYRQKTETEIMDDGAWTNVEATVLGPVYSSLEAAQAQANRLNMLNAMELQSATDAYGRVFTFEYETFFRHYTVDSADDKPRRSRLAAIRFRGKKLVEYRHTTLELFTTSDAYLTEVKRRGFLGDTEDGPTTTTTYTYPHELFAPGGIMHRLESGAWATQRAQAIDATLTELNVDHLNCGGVSIRINPVLDDLCSVAITPDTSGSPPEGQNAMWDILRRAVADNIIRIKVDGDIELESRYDINIFNDTFDHVVEQRYGPLPLPLPLADVEPVFEPSEVLGDPAYLVHTWLSDMPTAAIDYYGGNKFPFLPVVTHGLLESPVTDLGLPPACGFAVLAQLPLFDAKSPVGPRVDQDPNLPEQSIPVAQTNASCSEVAGRWARSHNPTELVPWRTFGAAFDGDSNPKDRARRTWDLNLVCSWVATVDRHGAEHYHGLNFEGTPLAERHPLPSGVGFALTVRRVNGDGNLIEQKDPDGQIIQLEYDDVAIPRLSRDLVTKVVEFPSPLGSLEPALRWNLTNATQPAFRETIIHYEPMFQQVSEVIRPDASRSVTLYDYQQGRNNSMLSAPLLFRLAARTGTRISGAGVMLGQDLDGDGEFYGERSSQPVVRFQQNVVLAPGTTGEIGERFMRDVTGRLDESWQIVDAADPSQDFNRNRYEYYENLSKSEAGDLAIGNCRKPCGPLGRVTQYRFPEATNPDDLDVHFMAYDRFGGVRLTVDNNDAATTETTTRDALGRLVTVKRPEGELLEYDVDPRGRTRAIARQGVGVPTEVTTFAIGLGDLPIGSCEELVVGACAGFEAFARDAFERAQIGIALPPPLANANYTIDVTDLEGRPLHQVGPFGLELSRTYNQAGAMTSETVFGTPSVTTTYTHDLMGRVVSSSTGTGTERLRSFMLYDRLGRLSSIQTRQPVAQGAFSSSFGTIERLGYDFADNLVRREVFGPTGVGTARAILSLELVEQNGLGQPLFIHRLSRSALSATSPAKTTSGTSSTDQFATEAFRYDTAGRLQRYEREGVALPSTADYDHFGLTSLVTPTVAQKSVVRIPRLRREETSTTWRRENDLGAATGMTTIKAWSPRGLLQDVVTIDAALPGVSHQTTNTYDGHGRLQHTKDATGRFKEVVRGSLGRVSKEIVGQNGTQRTTKFSYDARGRVLERTPEDAPATSFVWDTVGRLTSELTDDELTDLLYDSSGRRHKVEHTVNGVMRTQNISYGDNRTVHSTVKVEGGTALSVSRDGLDRPIVSTATNQVLSADASSEPGLVGSRPSLSTTLTFDSLGRMVRDRTTGTFPTSSPTRPGQSNVTLVDKTQIHPLTYAGASSLNLASGDSLLKYYASGGGLRELVWNNATSPKYTATFGSAGGLWTTATTDDALREKVRDGFGAVTGSNFTADKKWIEEILRGPTGRIVSTRINSPSFGVRVESHQYDALSRLKGSTIDHNSSRQFATADVVAAASNETFDPIISADATVTHDHGEADTLKATSPDAFGRRFDAVYDTVTPGLPPTSINGMPISRDGRERISYDKQLTYTFDSLDRLVLVQRDGTDELRLAYDGLGRRRLERRGKTGTADTDVVLEYDGPNVIQETAAATGAIQFSTMHAPAIDAPMATWFGQLTPSTTVYDLGTNARGDVTVATKGGGFYEEQLLDPYGEREAKNGGASCIEGKEAGNASLPMQTCTSLRILQRFGIGGARQHPSTKLVDLRNRVYATHLRGFLTKDPMGSIDSDGLYNYVAGDPVNLRDPWGLSVTESVEDELNIVNVGGNTWETRPPTCDDKCERKENARVLREAEQSGVFDDDPPTPREPRRQPTRREGYERAQGRVPTRPWQQGMVPVIGPARDFGEDMERSLIAIEHDRIGDAWSFGLLSFASGLFAVIDGLSLGASSALAGAARAEARNIVRAEITGTTRATISPSAEAVLAETRAGQGDIGSSETLNSTDALAAGAEWVGPGYREMGGDGKGVFRSADGTRQFRLDKGSISGSHGPVGPHVHFEIVNPNRTGRQAVEVNNHVPIVD